VDEDKVGKDKVRGRRGREEWEVEKEPVATTTTTTKK